MKKRKKVIYTMITMLFLLSGCAEVPDNIKQEISIRDNSQVDPVGEAEYLEWGNVEEIRGQLERDLQKTYSNLDIENARVGNGTLMPVYDVKITGAGYDGFKPLIRFLFKDQYDYEDKELYYEYEKYAANDKNYPATKEPMDYDNDGKINTPNSWAYGVYGFRPDKNDQTKSIYAYSTGNCWGSPLGSSNSKKYFFEAYSAWKTYDLQYEVIAEDLSYKMNDGQDWNVLEAVEYIEAFWNDRLSEFDPQKYEYKVKKLCVVNFWDETYGYFFSMQTIDENGNYLDTDNIYVRDTEAIQSNQPFLMENGGVIWCCGKEEITRFIKEFSMEYLKQTDNGDRLLSLGAASDILSGSLASENVVRIESAELNYVLTCKGYPYFQIWEYPAYYAATCRDTCEFEIRPYWCFRPEQCTWLGDDLEVYFVDALTGDVLIMQNYRLIKKNAD